MAATDSAIDITDLTIAFGTFTALDGLTFHVKHGSVHGFLGPNGAGKSTTIRALLGLLRPQKGSVRILGEDPVDNPQILKHVGYVPGDVALWPQLTGQETLDALARLRGVKPNKQRQQGLIDAFDLDPHKRCRDYSTGNKRKVLLIAALSADAELLILDEPTAGLDPLMERVFVEQVRSAANNGATVLLSSHILSEVERLYSYVTVIKQGRVVDEGDIDTLRNLAGYSIAGALPSGERIRREVRADEVNPELQQLLASGVSGITVAPASLEEVFLRHYSDTQLGQGHKAGDQGNSMGGNR